MKHVMNGPHLPVTDSTQAIAFLDEITSGLDNETAYEIEKRLLDEIRGEYA